MGYFTFDGDTKEISLNLLEIPSTLDSNGDNVYTYSAQRLYSEWKDWLITDDNSKYPIAFDTIGGEPISGTINVGDYYFMRTDNGWIGVAPSTENNTVIVEGNLFPRVPEQNIMKVIPDTGFSTTFIQQTSSLTQTSVITSGSALTTEQDDKLMKTLEKNTFLGLK